MTLLAVSVPVDGYQGDPDRDDCDPDRRGADTTDEHACTDKKQGYSEPSEEVIHWRYSLPEVHLQGPARATDAPEASAL
jgi:hypothetical protein